MSREEFNKQPDPKFKQGQYIIGGEDQEFEISFVQWDFDYYFPMPHMYAGKVKLS